MENYFKHLQSADDVSTKEVFNPFNLLGFYERLYNRSI